MKTQLKLLLIYVLLDSESTNIDFSLIADTIFIRVLKITHKQYFYLTKIYKVIFLHAIS